MAFDDAIQNGALNERENKKVLAKKNIVLNQYYFKQTQKRQVKKEKIGEIVNGVSMKIIE